jgi:hypothetical protein
MIIQQKHLINSNVCSHGELISFVSPQNSSDLMDLLGIVQWLRNRKTCDVSNQVDDDIDDSVVWYRQLGTVPPRKQQSDRRSQNGLQPNGRHNAEDNRNRNL